MAFFTGFYLLEIPIFASNQILVQYSEDSAYWEHKACFSSRNLDIKCPEPITLFIIAGFPYQEILYV